MYTNFAKNYTSYPIHSNYQHLSMTPTTTINVFNGSNFPYFMPKYPCFPQQVFYDYPVKTNHHQNHFSFMSPPSEQSSNSINTWRTVHSLLNKRGDETFDNNKKSTFFCFKKKSTSFEKSPTQETRKFVEIQKENIPASNIKLEFAKFQKISFDKNKNSKNSKDQLLNLSLKFISEKEIKNEDLINLEKEDLVSFFVYPFKRNLITANMANHFISLPEANKSDIVEFLNNCKKLSNMNEFSFKETVINRVLRKCFWKWIKANESLVENENNNFEINKMFWKYLFELTDKKDFDIFYAQIKKNYQICKKHLLKKRKNVYSNQTKKFFNILINKKIFLLIIEILKDNQDFKHFYQNYKNGIYDKYSKHFQKSTFLENSDKIKNEKLKFTVDLKFQLNKFFDSIKSDFNCQEANFNFSESLKKKIKKYSSPITFSDYKKIFEKIEKYI